MKTNRPGKMPPRSSYKRARKINPECCTYWKRYKGLKAPRCNDGNPCQACQAKWKESPHNPANKPEGKFFWLNMVNLVELGGPFPTAKVAREDCAKTYKTIQGGMALCVVILEQIDSGCIKTESGVTKWESEA